MDAKTIAQILDELGRRIEGPAEAAWEIFMRQAVIYGAVEIVCAILCIFGAFVVILLAVKSGDDEWYGPAGFAGTILFVFTCVLAIKGTMFLLNPSYYALEMILKNLPGISK